MQSHVKSLLRYPAELTQSPLELKDRCTSILLLLAMGRNEEAKKAFYGDTSLDVGVRREIAKILNQEFLLERNLEWTNHGPQRTFRFWSPMEKQSYLMQANTLADTMRDLTPNVCFGFGAVLGIVRDQDFIGHDDDLDLLIALDPMRFEIAKDKVREFLHGRGFVCHGTNHSHFGVNAGKGRAVDVFIGFREEDRVSWFPSRRRSLAWNAVFPAQSFAFMGHNIPLPADMEAYLLGTYGSSWRHPEPGWSHSWDISEYRDFL